MSSMIVLVPFDKDQTHSLSGSPGFLQVRAGEGAVAECVSVFYSEI